MVLEGLRRALFRLLTYRERSERLEAVVAIALLAFAVLVVSGFIYVIVTAPPALYGTRPVFPSITGQTIVEFVLVALAYTLSFLGLYLIHLTAMGRFAARSGVAVGAGISLFVVGLLTVISMLVQKFGG